MTENEILTLQITPLSIGKSIFVCLIKMINDWEYEKNDICWGDGGQSAYGLLAIRHAR
jgi:hypothetical protein